MKRKREKLDRKKEEEKKGRKERVEDWKKTCRRAEK